MLQPISVTLALRSVLASRPLASRSVPAPSFSATPAPRSAPHDFQPAPLRFPLRSHAMLMILSQNGRHQRTVRSPFVVLGRASGPLSPHPLSTPLATNRTPAITGRQIQRTCHKGIQTSRCGYTLRYQRIGLDK